MGKVPFIDFQEVKRSLTIEDVMAYTGLPFKKQGQSYRCECPQHKGGKRTLVVTPDERDQKGDPGVFYCHAAQEGGDRLALLAHVNGTKQYAAVKELAERFAPGQKNERKNQVPEEKEEKSRGERGFQPLPYLEHEHETVTALGLSPDVAKALGIGFSPRGVHRGRIAIPIRTADGILSGYISILGGDVKLPPKWHI